MLADSENPFFILYPIAFDKHATRSEGRKYSKDVCINPSMKTIKNGLKSIKGLKFIEESTKRHPKDLKTLGRFKILSSERKEIINQLIAYFKKRCNPNNPSTSNNESTIKYVARKKKKGKKK